MIVIKNKKVYFKRRGEYTRLKLLVSSHGGCLPLLKGIMLCYLGKHTIISFVGFEKNESGDLCVKRWKACMYCGVAHNES